MYKISEQLSQHSNTEMPQISIAHIHIYLYIQLELKTIFFSPFLNPLILAFIMKEYSSRKPSSHFLAASLFILKYGKNEIWHRRRLKTLGYTGQSLDIRFFQLFLPFQCKKALNIIPKTFLVLHNYWHMNIPMCKTWNLQEDWCPFDIEQYTDYPCWQVGTIQSTLKFKSRIALWRCPTTEKNNRQQN